MELVTIILRSNPQVPRPAAWEDLIHLFFMATTAWNLRPALVLWQRSNLTLLEGGWSQEEKTCLLSTLASSLRRHFHPSLKEENSRQMWALRNRTHQSYVTVGDEALCAWSHLQGGGVEICFYCCLFLHLLPVRQVVGAREGCTNDLHLCIPGTREGSRAGGTIRSDPNGLANITSSFVAV